MLKKRSLNIPIMVGAMALALAVAPLPTLVAAKPNVLFISVDDMNDWGIGGHSQAITPNIDALAARGLTFTNAHSAGVKCGPSRTAIFAGQYPSTTGFYDDQVYWQADETSRNENLIGLHTAFGNAGYKTLGTGKLFHHAAGWIDQRGWDQYWLRTDATTNAQRENGWDVHNWKYGAPNPGGPDGEFVSIYNTTYPETKAGVMEWAALANTVESEMADTQRADWVISQINTDHGDTPFFLGLGIFTPHSPQYAPQKYYDAYLDGPLNGNVDNLQLPSYWKDGSTNPLPDLDDVAPRERIKERNTYHRWMAKLKDISPNDRTLKECILGYLAAITYADAQIGRVLTALSNSPYADNTVVVLWSDHGYHLGEKGHWAKHVMWERGSQVPFVWAGPGIAEGTTTDATASLIDMYPTFVELCGLTKDGANANLQPLDGESLVPTLENPDQASDREVIISNLQAHEYAITNRDWRYIRYGDGQEELYDHNNDPNEWDNLANEPAYQSIRADMRSKAPASIADFALLHRQYARRDKDDGTWYFADHQVKVNLTLSSNAPDVVTGDFHVTAQYTTGITGFEVGDLKAINGSILSFKQVSPDRYTFTVRPNPTAVGELILARVPKKAAIGIPNSRETNSDDVFVARRYHPDAAKWIPPKAIPAIARQSGLAVQFSSDGSSDEGTVDAWVWQFGDGAVSTSRNPSHTYAQAGTYVVTLGVTDNDGVGSDLVSIKVVVSNGGLDE
jgi:arylsulfatase A-like enzyme